MMTKTRRSTPSKRSARARSEAPPAHPHVAAALQYCRDVLAQKIPASKLTQLACRRHLDDLERATGNTVNRTARPDFPFYFDADQAERVCRFGEQLPHVKGKWARRDPLNPRANRIRLEPWQCFLLISLFGWLRCGTARKLPSGRMVGLRRFTEADFWCARKNAKSTTACIIGHWMFAKDDEPGAEVYCGAGSKKQAWEVFGPARQMCIAEPRLQKDLGIEVNAQSLLITTGGALAKFEPVIGKPGDGASPHCAIIDEYHEHKTSDQFDTFQTGMGAREQSLILVISTAGQSVQSPARERWRSGEKLLQRTFVEEHRFVLIYTVDDPETEWKTELGLRKANPNWGVSVIAPKILANLESAKREAAKQGAFKTKHANIWVFAVAAYFNFEFWKKCYERTLDRADLRGATCYDALDLASKVNLAARASVFPLPEGRFAVFGRYYAPAYTVQLPQNQHLYRWAQQGWLTVHDGQVLDFPAIRADLYEDAAAHRIAEVAVDPWQSTETISELRAKNLNAFEFRQVVQNMSEPMKNLDAHIRTGKIRHDGNPITAWCIGNVVAQVDRKENVYPRKERDSDNIDGAVAIIMAFGRAIANALTKTGSVYETRGIRPL
jgi:phage terminase large subunit-like protein